MNIGILAPANTNPYASALLAKLVARGSAPRAVICTEPSRAHTLLDHLRVNGLRVTARRALQHYRLVRHAGSDVRQHLREHMSAERIAGWDRPLSQLCRRWSIDYLTTASANTPRTVRTVRSRNIDLLLNTGAEILKKEIIQSSRIGILNAHMARLPFFRGMNVLEWSLFEGQPLGVTLHLIDEGVDTGGVLLFREIPVAKGDTLTSLRSKAVVVSVDLMTEGVQLFQARRARPGRQSQAAGKQHYVMHPRLRAVAAHRLAQHWT